jgi:hypothetical protein
MMRFCLHNLGLPVATVGLFLYRSGESRAPVLVAFGPVIVVVGIGCFVVSVMRTLRRPLDP